MDCSVNHATLNLKFCPSCGANISNSSPSPVTPTQNTWTPQQNIQPVAQQNFNNPIQPVQSATNTLAIVGFITSLVCCGTPAGIVFSAIALGQIKKNPSQGGKGLATAGLILGILGSIGGFIYLVVAAIGTSGY